LMDYKNKNQIQYTIMSSELTEDHTMQLVPTSEDRYTYFRCTSSQCDRKLYKVENP